MQLVLDNRIYKTALFAFRQGKDAFVNIPTYIYVRDCKQKCLWQSINAISVGQ